MMVSLTYVCAFSTLPVCLQICCRSVYFFVEKHLRVAGFVAGLVADLVAVLLLYCSTNGWHRKCFQNHETFNKNGPKLVPSICLTV